MFFDYCYLVFLSFTISPSFCKTLEPGDAVALKPLLPSPLRSEILCINTSTVAMPVKCKCIFISPNEVAIYV